MEEVLAITEREKILDPFLGVDVVFLVLLKALLEVGVFVFLKGVIFLIVPGIALDGDFLDVAFGLFRDTAIYIYFFIKC